MSVKICYFGSPDNDNSRNRVLLRGLDEIGAISCVCSDKSFWPFRIIRLFFKHWRVRNKYDVMFIGFPGQIAVILAKFVTRKPVVFDPFISLYNTVIEDRKFHSRISLQSLWYFTLDWLSLNIADAVIADTVAHADYYRKKFGVRKEKFAIVPVGVREDIFFPRLPKDAGRDNMFIASFHGTYIPLHGIEYIIESAKLLEKEKSVHFRLLGTGQVLPEIKSLVKKYKLSNIELIEKRLSYEELPEYISSADVCLGIFGKTEKARMVVPNKVYECLAMGKPIITADTPAVREFFKDGESIALVDADDPSSLSDCVMSLKNDINKMNKLSLNGLELSRRNFTSRIIAERMVKDISILVSL